MLEEGVVIVCRWVGEKELKSAPSCLVWWSCMCVCEHSSGLYVRCVCVCVCVCMSQCACISGIVTERESRGRGPLNLYPCGETALHQFFCFCFFCCFFYCFLHHTHILYAYVISE